MFSTEAIFGRFVGNPSIVEYNSDGRLLDTFFLDCSQPRTPRLIKLVTSLEPVIQALEKLRPNQNTLLRGRFLNVPADGYAEFQSFSASAVVEDTVAILRHARKIGIDVFERF